MYYRDVTYRLCRFKVKQGVLLMYFIYSTLSFENEIIYILMYFIETRQLGLEPESARKDNAKQDLQQITVL